MSEDRESSSDPRYCERLGIGDGGGAGGGGCTLSVRVGSATSMLGGRNNGVLGLRWAAGSCPVVTSAGRTGQIATGSVAYGNTLGRTLGASVEATSRVTVSRVKNDSPPRFGVVYVVCTTSSVDVPRDVHGLFPNSEYGKVQ